MQAPRTLGLPCSWAPLQSVTAAASRRIPCSPRASGKFAGQSHLAALGECRVSGLVSHTRRRGSESSLRFGQARTSAKPDARVKMLALCRTSTEVDARHCTGPRMATRTRTSFATSFTRTRAEAWAPVLPQHLEVGRNRFRDTEATLSVVRRRSVELPPGSLRGPAYPPSPK